MSISISALQVSRRLLAGVIGQPVDADYLNACDTYINADPQAVQVYTVVLTAETNNATYTFTCDGQTISYTADGSATYAEVGAGLLAAFNANAHARGLFVATFATDTLTLTAVNTAIDVVVSDSDSKITTTEVTAPAGATAVRFGVGIVNLGTTNDEGTPLGAEVYAAKLTAQVDTLTVVYAANERYYVEIDIPGQTPVSVDVAADTDTAGTTTAIVTAINLRMPSNTVLAASSVSGTITLTSEIPGQGFVTGVGTVSGTASRLSVSSNAPMLSSLPRWFAGISTMTLDTSIATIAGTEAKYDANSGVIVLRKGRIYVENSQTPGVNDKVYVETVAGTTQGKFFNSSSATRIFVPNARWHAVPSRTSSENLAIVELF